MEELKLPTEQVELPSKGLVYPKDNPLSSGVVEMKYMTAKEEDILTNQNYISNGTVLDKLLESLVISEGVKVKDLIVGDKNAVLVAARILGYGKDYTFIHGDEKITVDLATIESKPFNENIIDENGFINFTLPKSETNVKFKILSEKEEDDIKVEIKNLSKFKGKGSGEVTVRLKHQIVSVDGKEDKTEIKNFVDNYMLAQDSRALRNYVKEISPDVDMSYILDNGEEITIPIGVGFFWPDL